MFTMKRLSACTFHEALQAWNRGFEGYFFDMTMSLDRFISRFGMEGLSPELSIVAIHDGEPVGLVLTGVRTIDGKKVAWNGGTGVASSFRSKGLGKLMMKEILKVYREAGVDTAVLEAVQQNEKAISLYQRFGYEVIDRLLFLQRSEALGQNPFKTSDSMPYTLIKGVPQDVRGLSFYRSMSPWQSQWASVHNGESLLVSDHAGHPVGYAIYKRTIDESGQLSGITLMQCEAAPEREDADDIVRAALSKLFAPHEQSCRRTTSNFPASNLRVVKILQEAGFESGLEQVYMKKEKVGTEIAR